MKLMDGHNPRPVLSFQPILIVGTLFGITPIYDYKIRKLAHENLYICFALFAVCLVTVCSVILTRGRFILYEEAPATLRVLDTVVDMSGVILYVISSLGSTFWNMKTWDKLINQLCQLERWVYLENAGKRKSFTRRNLLSFFIGGSLLYVILVIYQFLYMRHIFIYYITQISLNYMVYVLIYIIYNITFSIKTSYDDLNHMLLMVNTINITTKEATKTIRKVRIRSLEIDSVIDTFNTLFGWPILLLVAHSFGQILTCISLFTTGLHHELFIRLLILYHFFANMVLLLVLTTGCDGILKASHRIFQNCCELKTSLPVLSKITGELDKLIVTLQIQSKITAAGFFEINRCLWLSISSTITTYMIVIIQFRSLK